MGEPTTWKSSIITVITGAALLTSTAASAQNGDFQQGKELVAKAEGAHNSAHELAEEGLFDSACEAYNRAFVGYNRAMVHLNSLSLVTRSEADYAQTLADHIQRNRTIVIAGIEGTCGRPNAPKYSYQKRELQSLATRSESQSNDALSKYRARDFVGACASARLAADGWNKVVQDMKANSALEPAFVNPAQIYANAQAATEDRDEVYCKGQG